MVSVTLVEMALARGVGGGGDDSRGSTAKTASKETVNVVSRSRVTVDHAHRVGEPHREVPGLLAYEEEAISSR